jgi:prolyl-tRNA editing enzyme YbaK/EbsC (Cys-tRNA(Pro) deacylase)
LKGSERVQAVLEAAGVAIEVVKLEASTRTAQLAAEAIGTELGSIVKSLLFLADGVPILVLVSGDHRADPAKDHRADPAKLKKRLGARRVMIADAERVKRETGFAIGGVPPIGHVQPLSVWVDESLGRFETVYAAAGHPHAVFAISFDMLVQLTNGHVADIA